MLLHVALLVAIVYFVLGLKKPAIALITLPVLCGVFIFIGFTEYVGDTLDAVFAIAIVVIATFSSVFLAWRRPNIEKWRLIWTWAKWLVLCLALLVLAVILFALLSEVPSFGFPLLVLFVALIGLIGAAISFGLTSRHSTAAYVISTIGASMRQNLPLPMALESAAGGRDDKRSRILQGIGKWLVEGYSLSEAIQRGFPRCPSYALAMIAAAERINQLPQALKSIEADMASRSEDSRQIQPVNLYYPLVLLILVGFMAWAVLTFVMPSFTNVLIEMTDGAELPKATQILLQIGHFIGWEGQALFVIALLFAAFVVIPYCIYVRFRQRRPNEPYTSSQIGDFLKWHLPVLRSFEKNYSILHVAEMLRLSLNSGATVNDAISYTLRLDLNNCFRKRLEIWLDKVEAGENISQAARQSGVGDSLAWAFDEQANQGNAPAILETLESLHRSNYNYRANLVRFIASPCITLAMGALVGFVVYAIYSAPVEIIYSASETVYP